MLHYVLMLCLHAPVFTLADKQSLGIHYSPPPPPVLGLTLCCHMPSTDVWLHCFTMLLSAPPQCSVSKPTCHCHQATRRASRLGHRAHQHLPGGPKVTRGLAMPGQARPLAGLNGGGLCLEERGWWWSRISTLIRAYGLTRYPGACWSPLNGTPCKNRLCHCVRCSKALSVPLFGRAWLLSGLWDTRMSREQLAHSEQTAAPQETLSISSKHSSSAPTNTQRRLGSVSSSSLSPPFCCLCVPWLASQFGFGKQNKRGR